MPEQRKCLFLEFGILNSQFPDDDACRPVDQSLQKFQFGGVWQINEELQQQVVSVCSKSAFKLFEVNDVTVTAGISYHTHDNPVFTFSQTCRHGVMPIVHIPCRLLDPLNGFLAKRIFRVVAEDIADTGGRNSATLRNMFQSGTGHGTNFSLSGGRKTFKQIKKKLAWTNAQKPCKL